MASDPHTGHFARNRQLHGFHEAMGRLYGSSPRLNDLNAKKNTVRSFGRPKEDMAKTEEDDVEPFGGVESMQRIVRSLARREDIPEEWWAEAGLSRTLSRNNHGNDVSITTRGPEELRMDRAGVEGPTPSPELGLHTVLKHGTDQQEIRAGLQQNRSEQLKADLDFEGTSVMSEISSSFNAGEENFDGLRLNGHLRFRPPSAQFLSGVGNKNTISKDKTSTTESRAADLLQDIGRKYCNIAPREEWPESGHSSSSRGWEIDSASNEFSFPLESVSTGAKLQTRPPTTGRKRPNRAAFHDLRPRQSQSPAQSLADW